MISSRLVLSNTELADICKHCAGVNVIAIDTEFMRTDTFYAWLALIQIYDGETIWLIDPLAIDDMAPLKELLTNTSVIKVFHACSEDLEVLQSSLGVLPTPLFDTQIAASFLGYGFSKGYSKLVNEVLDIQLDKHETRSNWLQRPLTESQCRYAAEDVYYLMSVYTQLVDALDAKNRIAWLQEDMEAILAVAAAPIDLDLYYLKVKGAWKLSSLQLSLFQALTRWREQQAREKNKPRNRIVADKVLLELVTIMPASRQQLFSIEGLYPQVIRRYGETLLALLNDHNHSPHKLETIPEPLDRNARKILSGCRAVLETKATELGMSPELLAKKKNLEVIIRTKMAGQAQLPTQLAAGWRYTVIGEALLAYVK